MIVARAQGLLEKLDSIAQRYLRRGRRQRHIGTKDRTLRDEGSGCGSSGGFGFQCQGMVYRLDAGRRICHLSARNCCSRSSANDSSWMAFVLFKIPQNFVRRDPLLPTLGRDFCVSAVRR